MYEEAAIQKQKKRPSMQGGGTGVHLGKERMRTSHNRRWKERERERVKHGHHSKKKEIQASRTGIIV